MERSVAVGSASGVASTVVLAILKSLSDPNLGPLETLQQCLECGLPEWAAPGFALADSATLEALHLASGE